jgi:DNA-binding response OmpR family regulator
MTPASIFVTDDEPAYVMHVKEPLTDAGYTRVVCHVGASVFHHIRDEQPDLVLLASNLSNPARGWSTLDALRFHPQTRHIAVILCSTDRRLLEEKADVLREMQYQTLEKPYASETLRDLVAAAIGPPPGLAQLAQTRHQYARALRAEEMEVSTAP